MARRADDVNVTPHRTRSSVGDFLASQEFSAKANATTSDALDLVLDLARRTLRVAQISFVSGGDAGSVLAAIARYAAHRGTHDPEKPRLGSVLTVSARAFDGRTIGALVASDSRKRDFSDDEVATLRDFARLAAEHVQRRTSDDAAANDERALRRIADAMPAILGYWNRDLRCGFANAAYRAWFGREPEHIVGSSMVDVLGPRLFALNETEIRGALDGVPQHFQRRFVQSDGHVTMTDIRYIPDVDAGGVVCGFYVMATDVTRIFAAQRSLEETNVKLSAEAMTDYLTGLNNRRLFERRSAEAHERFVSTGAPYGVILLDLDGFKNINDTLGHGVGDDVLRVVGRFLKEEMRGDDFAARIGGEEFAILSYGVRERSELCALAERIRAGIGRQSISTAPGSPAIAVTCSLGVALGDRSDRSFASVYDRADAALYAVKRRGKNAVGFGDAAA